jgi:hypothetical protein
MCVPQLLLLSEHLLSEFLSADRNTPITGLYSLPLSVLPVTHPVLRKSRLMKNGRFESVIELYRDKNTGSGQYYVDTVMTMLGISYKDGPDAGLLRSVALLPTFDVFSVRLLMRDLEIPVDVSSALAPPVDPRLDEQMRKFTVPLLRHVYGGGTEAAGLQDLIALFRDPNIKRAEAHLKRLAEKLHIPLLEVPRFLEDYSDTFLAISLYQNTFTSLEPSVDKFLEALKRLKSDFLRNNAALSALTRVHADFSSIMKSTAKRLAASEQLVGLLWGDNLNAPFETLQPKIREFQFLLGYLLCGISVKLAAWNEAFPQSNIGTPQKCMELITTDIVYALSKLRMAADNGLKRNKIAMAGDGANLQSFLRSLAAV